MDLNGESKDATEHTIKSNDQVKINLPFDNIDDFKNADRGFIAKPDMLTITSENGEPIWDLEQYKSFISDDKTSPDTVNPSLWRNAQLTIRYGLYEVMDGIYQVRSYDLSNITFIRGKTGWIVFDPLISPETAAAALALINKELGVRDVVAVVYSHSHVDHYGGVSGFINENNQGSLQIFAPEEFTEHAVSENVIAGNAMGRRAVYMYGAMLPRDAKGGVNGGLGMTISTGVSGLIRPTTEIKRTGKRIIVDGVTMEFQMTPGTEAPAEMNTWFPDLKALWMAENTTNTMHNILTLRGAQVRDALKWSSFLNETMERYGDEVQVKFQSHHWPVWDNENIIPYFEKQRDVYKFIHDQTVRRMNQGYNGEEISEMIELPKSLEQNWSTRGYYGTLRHNSRAVYQFYMGWYNGNPSDLNNYPPEQAAKRYVDFMGGEKEIIKKAQESFDKGDYRWVAEVMKHVVFANDRNKTAKYLLADALEQLGYQSESGPWRSVYLQGAWELRNGVPNIGGTQTATPDTIRSMTPEMLFDYWGVKLNAEKAEGKDFSFNIIFTDLNSEYSLSVKNSVLNYSQLPNPDADAKMRMDKTTMDKILLGETTYEKAVKDGLIKIEGDKSIVDDFIAMLDNFEFWFNIVTP
ncbi:MBL fold metallo-hydrolase [Shewanella sp. VB17]|nr:MBL fold metallo-hydrolase [Shewanella sp. VB17]